MKPPLVLDLNCDVGEAETPEQVAQELRLLPLVTSVNVACGGHAGGPAAMRRTVQAARAQHLAIGAHPGFPDRTSHGRREQEWTTGSVRELIHSQVGALREICREESVRLSHVKPHGALYNMAARDRTLAEAIATAVFEFDPSLILVGLAGSALVAAGAALGLVTASEGFADRAYRSDGSLSPRDQPGAVIDDDSVAVAQALSITREGTVRAIDGSVLLLRIDTLCLHGDTPGALTLAQSLRRALVEAGVVLRRIEHDA
jgi:UPF0271 protein